MAPIHTVAPARRLFRAISDMPHTYTLAPSRTAAHTHTPKHNNPRTSCHTHAGVDAYPQGGAELRAVAAPVPCQWRGQRASRGGGVRHCEGAHRVQWRGRCARAVCCASGCVRAGGCVLVSGWWVYKWVPCVQVVCQWESVDALGWRVGVSMCRLLPAGEGAAPAAKRFVHGHRREAGC